MGRDLDSGTDAHQYALIRTTIDLPDELSRALKARPASSGVTLRDLGQRFVEQGLRQPSVPVGADVGRRQPPPVIIGPKRAPIPAVSRAQVRRLEEEEDEVTHA